MKQKIKKWLWLEILVVVFLGYAIVTDQILGGGKDLQKDDSGTAEVAGRTIQVLYVPKESLAPAFGTSFLDYVKIRSDLSPRVKRFVRSHELYHVKDRSNAGGWMGREIRANLIPGLTDPVGLLATIKASLSPERLKFYWQRLMRGQ